MVHFALTVIFVLMLFGAHCVWAVLAQMKSTLQLATEPNLYKKLYCRAFLDALNTIQEEYKNALIVMVLAFSCTIMIAVMWVAYASGTRFDDWMLGLLCLAIGNVAVRVWGYKQMPPWMWKWSLFVQRGYHSMRIEQLNDTISLIQQDIVTIDTLNHDKEIEEIDLATVERRFQLAMHYENLIAMRDAQSDRLSQLR